ncbi:hypothetical protein LguiB_001532 [Lonicera macranthoides]
MATTRQSLVLDPDMPLLSRKDFPSDFVFGSASSAYQYEGAVTEGGRGPSIWDTFTEDAADGFHAREAVDHYHRYEEDIAILKEMGFDAYRLSIAWPRVMPSGKKESRNEGGIQYYNNIIDCLLKNGIQPYVTLFHWDLPQPLEDEYGGFLSDKIADDFADYAELCFQEFGDRVKHWITLNEPWSFSYGGYVLGTFAPGRCTEGKDYIKDFLPSSRCTSQEAFNLKKKESCGGDSGTEPYIISHNQLLAHAAAVKVYKHKYQKSQKGKIGITLVSVWNEPLTDSEADRKAALRALDFMFGWFMDPITFGDYPKSMRDLVKDRLPKFTKEQSKSLKGSFDFLGLNYYTANYTADVPNPSDAPPSYTTDSQASLLTERKGVSIGIQGGSEWLYVYPKGIKDMLLYIKTKYHNPDVYITENGIDEVNDPKLSLTDALADKKRISYHYDHLSYVQQAIEEGAKLKGYFAWSLLDNFEWAAGYSVRFGINFIDFKDGLKRYPKQSSGWFKFLLQK